MPPKRPWQAIFCLILPDENKTNTKSYLTVEDALQQGINWMQQQGPDDPHRASVYVHNKDALQLPDDAPRPESYRLEWVSEYKAILQTTWPSRTALEGMRVGRRGTPDTTRRFKIAAVAPGGDERMVGRELADDDLVPVPETAREHPAQPRLTLVREPEPKPTTDPVRVPPGWQPIHPEDAANLRREIPERFTIESICANRRARLAEIEVKMTELKARSSALIDRYVDLDLDASDGVLEQLREVNHEKDALIGYLLRATFELAALEGVDHPTCPVCGTPAEGDGARTEDDHDH